MLFGAFHATFVPFLVVFAVCVYYVLRLLVIHVKWVWTLQEGKKHKLLGAAAMAWFPPILSGRLRLKYPDLSHETKRLLRNALLCMLAAGVIECIGLVLWLIAKHYARQ